MNDGNFSEEEIAALKALSRHAETIERLVKKEESWTLVLSTTKAAAVWIAAIIAAIAISWEWLVRLIKQAVK